MSRLSDQEIQFLKLVQRSPDQGDDWRLVSWILWPLVEKFEHDRPDLVDTDPACDTTSEYAGRVRLSQKALVVMEYLV